MDRGVAVHLAGAGLKDPGVHALGQTEHVDRAHHRRLGRLDRVKLVVRRRGGAGQVVDLVDLELERVDHVVAHQLEVGAAVEVGNVALAAGKKVIEANDVVAVFEQAVAEVGTQKAGAAGDKNTHGAAESRDGPHRSRNQTR